MEDLRYVFFGVVAFRRQFFFVVVVLSTFSQTIWRVRDRRKKTTSLCYRPINLPRFSTNPPKSFKFYEERLRVCLDVIVGYQLYATVTQTSFEVLAENGAWIMSEACVVFSCCIAAEENFKINQLLNSKSWHYVEPTSRETKRKASANAWRQRTIKSYIFTTDWSSRWNNTK